MDMSKPAPSAEATLGLVKISSASLEVIQQNGITAETIGLGRAGSGAMLVTLQVCQDVKVDLAKAILNAADYEAKSALSNALANIIKSETSSIKVTGDIPNGQTQGSKRRGKSFAPAAPIDVKSS